MDYDSDSSEGWINASSDSESSHSVTLNMGLSEQEQEQNLVNDSERKKHKKAKKRKHDDDSSVSDDRSAKKKHIKIEPESDRDRCGGNESIVHSESFDDLRVKLETADNPDEPRKKKKKHKKSEGGSNNESTLLNGTQDNNLETSYVEENERKKKKKKKSKCSESEDVRDETINSQEELQNGGKEDIVDLKSKRKYLLSSTVLENNLNETNETINISAIPSTVPKKTKRISDRLKFEDDEIVSTLENAYDSDKEVTYSREVTTFLKRNPNFSPFTSFVPFKTDEEDIFIVKCPSEIDVKDFKDINLVLDGKCKLKVAGQTYDGVVAKTDTKIPLVSYSKKNVYHKNLLVSKTIVFHKRIPVLHIQDDSVVTSNQTRFIPLPDTKCRHPLFGTDYKKAIKVPKVVRERMSENDLQSEEVEQETLYKNKKKKHKKEKETVEREYEVEVDSTVNVKEEGESSKKKKKKRKIKEETEAKPAKRVKLEQNPEAWESEKAIEENLFNF